MTLQCGMGEGDLVAYYDGEIRGARREYVELHVHHCDICQRQLALFQSSRILLQSHTELRDYPAARVAIVGQLRQSMTQSRMPRTSILAYAAALVVVGIIGALALGEVDPGALFSHGTKSPEGAPSTDNDTEINLQSNEPATQFVAPHELPMGFTLIAKEDERDDRRILQYRNDDGDTLQLTQTLSPNGTSEAFEDGELITVDGVDVTLITRPPKRDETELVWARQGVHFRLIIHDRAPSDIDDRDQLIPGAAPGVTPDRSRAEDKPDAATLSIARALMAAQNDE